MCWLWPTGHFEQKRMPRLSIIALTTPSHERTMTYAATNFSWKMNKRSETQEKKLKKKARPKTVMINRSMTCIYTTLCSWPWEQGMNMLLLAFSCTCIHDIVFSPWKRKSLLSLPFTDREPLILTVGALCRRVPNYYRYAFFRCLFRVANSCAVFFFFKPQEIDVPSTTHGKKGFCEIHVRVFLLCYFSEWRVTAPGFSIARLSRRDWCMCSPSLHLLLVFFFAWCGGLLRFWRSFSSLTAYADSLRYDRYAWTVGFWNFFTRQILEIPTNQHMKVCEKTVRFLEKLTCSK